MYLFLIHSHVTSKIEMMEKNGRESKDEIIEELLKSLIDGEIALKFGKCEETSVFVKKGVFNLAYIQGLSFEKSKEPDKFRVSKTRKSARKASKTGSGDKF